MVLLGQMHLAGLDLLVDKLDNPAALEADHVVVVGLGQLVLIAEAPITNVHLANKTPFFQYLQGTIDGGPGNGNLIAAQGEQDVITLAVLLAGQDILQDSYALAGETEPFSLQGILEMLDIAIFDSHVFALLRLSLNINLACRRCNHKGIS